MGKWKTPADLKYQGTDEWIRLEGEEGIVGITDYAQDQLNDIVFLELPAVGDSFAQGDSFGVVESVKAASDLHLPVSGTVTAVNNAVEEEPELANADPYGDAWLVRVRLSDAAELTGLMDAAAYDAHCDAR
ncbi:MAG: glycine cleavage system protein GcvH [Anaerolineaceae bacterium]|nr:glycine cleavage system protein GcvH [Anaerolineaceae bacterium]